MSNEPDPRFEELLEYLANTRGLDFTAYKRSTVMRRTRVRMENLHIDSFDAYKDRLEADPGEFGRLLDTLLINVTAFYRDPDAWEYLQREVVPKIIESRAPSDAIRVWSAGCSSGEEAFTLAMVFAEAMGVDETVRRLKIYATDVDEDALSTARHATYDARQLAETLPAELREKYFIGNNEAFNFHPDLRRAVIFGRHDLLRDAPISRLDLLCCRNTLMYFNAESQQRVLQNFIFALRDGGYLFLGKAETMMTGHMEVEAMAPKYRIFRKAPGESRRNRVLPALADAMRMPGDQGSTMDSRIADIMLDIDPDAQVVVTARGGLAFANQKARELFGLGARDLGRPIQDLEFSYRPIELRSILERVSREMQPTNIDNVAMQSGGEHRWYRVVVLPLVEERTFLGAKIVFKDVTAHVETESELERSRAELSTVFEELQSTNEELETTNEELQSTVEELETTNEELQSTNEELETMNEEIQSSNDELESLNTDLNEKAQALDTTKEFLESILASLLSAVIVVDSEMRVEIWNHAARDQWGLREEEAKGRYLPSLDIGLPVEQLIHAIRQALTEPGEPHQLTVSAINRRGREVECRVGVTARRHASEDVAGAIIAIDANG